MRTVILSIRTSRLSSMSQWNEYLANNKSSKLRQHFDVQVNSSSSQKNSWIACGFAQEYLRSCTGYRPGQSVTRRSKSCTLHSKKIFCLGGTGFLSVTS